MTAGVRRKKRSKTHNRSEERFLIGGNSANFQATYNRKSEKQTFNTTYLVLVGYGRLAEADGRKRAGDGQNAF